MAEYIEREAAIKKLDHFQSHLHTVEGTTAIGVAKTLINEIPAADVRPVVRGKWKKRRFSELAFGYECAVCHTTWDAPTNFCPNCAADMREES